MPNLFRHPTGRSACLVTAIFLMPSATRRIGIPHFHPRHAELVSASHQQVRLLSIRRSLSCRPPPGGSASPTSTPVMPNLFRHPTSRSACLVYAHTLYLSYDRHIIQNRLCLY